MSNSNPPIKLQMKWKDPLLFEATTDNGRRLVLDGDSEVAFSPMEALLGSLCGCMAIDVVMILQKMRTGLKSLVIEAEGERHTEVPRYFKKVNLTYRVEGDVPEEKVERAIQLSFDKYCSVFHSLRPDLEVNHRILRGPESQPVIS